MTRRFSARVMSVFMKKKFNFEWPYFTRFYIGNTNNGYHLSKSQNLFYPRKLTPRVKRKVYIVLTHLMTFLGTDWACLFD